MLAEDIRHSEKQPIVFEGGRKKIQKIKRDKRGRDGDLSWEGSLKKERSFQTPGNTLTAESVASLGTTEGNKTGRKNKYIIKTHRFCVQR